MEKLAKIYRRDLSMSRQGCCEPIHEPVHDRFTNRFGFTSRFGSHGSARHFDSPGSPRTGSRFAFSVRFAAFMTTIEEAISELRKEGYDVELDEESPDQRQRKRNK